MMEKDSRMPQLTLRIVTSSQQIKDFPLNQFSAIPVIPGATYSIIDVTDGSPAEQLVLKKKGASLLIEVAEMPVVEIQQF
jgi:hypothetical protein